MRLIFERKPVKFARGPIWPGTLAPGSGAAVGPLKLEPNEPLPLPGPDWVRLRRGWPASAAPTWRRSTARRRPYFEPIVSFPFVPGHEVVATTERRHAASCSCRC